MTTHLKGPDAREELKGYDAETPHICCFGHAQVRLPPLLRMNDLRRCIVECIRKGLAVTCIQRRRD